MTIEFDDTDFRATYGRTPKGYGSWAFSTRRNPDVADRDVVFWAPAGTFTEAKKAARAWIVGKFGKDADGVVYVCT